MSSVVCERVSDELRECLGCPRKSSRTAATNCIIIYGESHILQTTCIVCRTLPADFSFT